MSAGRGGKTGSVALRETIEAIVWRHRNGAKWRSVPADLVPWWRAAQTFIRWSQLGVWERLLEQVQDRGIELGMSFLDRTSTRAHHKGAGAFKKAHELPLARDLVDCLPGIPGWVVGDKGYASHAFRQFIWDHGARPAIPAKNKDAPVTCPGWVYDNRNRVERLWAHLKERRAVATRYEKTACFFMGVLCIAATFY